MCNTAIYPMSSINLLWNVETKKTPTGNKDWSFHREDSQPMEQVSQWGLCSCIIGDFNPRLDKALNNVVWERPSEVPSDLSQTQIFLFFKKIFIFSIEISKVLLFLLHIIFKLTAKYLNQTLMDTAYPKHFSKLLTAQLDLTSEEMKKNCIRRQDYFSPNL